MVLTIFVLLETLSFRHKSLYKEFSRLASGFVRKGQNNRAKLNCKIHNKTKFQFQIIMQKIQFYIWLLEIGFLFYIID